LQVSVRFFTTLREITGKREETIEFTKDSTITLGEVLQELAKKHGKDFTEYVYDRRTNQPKGYLQFLINGKSITPTKGLQTKLRDGDVLAIIPPVGGG
jgi:molybdopterin synthase sulfur carrier subunit